MISGCAGGGGSTTAEPTTATASPTPTTTATPAPLETYPYPSGVTAEGITDGEQLLSSTSDYLNQTSFASNVSLYAREEGETKTFAFATRSNLSTEHLYSYQEEPDQTRIYYRNGTSEYVKIIANGSTEYGTPRTDSDFAVTHRRLATVQLRPVRLAFRFGNYTATGVIERDGRRLVRYELEEPNWQNVELDHIDAANGTVLVDERGVVHRATYNLAGERDNRPVVIRVTYRLRATGAVTVPEPDWLSKAKR